MRQSVSLSRNKLDYRTIREERRKRMRVIDISQHNGDVDFRQVRASGVEAVMLRSSWGHFVEDLRFRENVR